MIEILAESSDKDMKSRLLEGGFSETLAKAAVELARPKEGNCSSDPRTPQSSRAG